ncbi:MAG: NAD-dependent epimerase/dehydratase family protein [Lachnospiraceae bacterium]|nr:NAD-dependent epimerase/dehydratase family protein [Lachnospiraceae bacterium]
MRILLAGHFSFFIRSLCDRLKKEGHEVYWLSGEDYQTRKEREFRWQYDFGFESPSMSEIINSAAPDTVIFMGAQDPYYGDFSDSEKSREYTSGLINILQTSYNVDQNTRFIYLSSEEVFSGRDEGTYDEKTECISYDSRGQAIRQGELAALTYQESFGMPVIVARLDHLYGLSESDKDMPYALKDFFRQALHEDGIDVRKDSGFGMLYEDDAAFFIYRLATDDRVKEDIYHLSSDAIVEEKQIADAINDGFGGKLRVTEHKLAKGSHRKLDPSRFNSEFNTHAFHEAQPSVAQLSQYIASHRKKYLGDQEEKSGGLKEGLKALLGLLVPFIENAIVFIPFFMLNNRFSGGSYFEYIDFYLLYVLLFAVAFGQQQGAFSAILATCGFIFRQQYTRSGFEVLVDYNTYIWIAQIFIVGLVVGNLKDRISLVREEDEREINYLKSRLSDIENVNTANVRIKGALETQIINQDDSLGKIYSITSKLDNSSPVEVLFDAAQVVGDIMGSGDVAVYQVANGDFARLYASTSKLSRSLGNSIRYTDIEPLYDAIGHKKVFINRQMEEGLPLMASGVWSDGSLDVIIMIWGLAWEQMTLAQSNKLTVVGLLIQNAISSSTRYINALEEKRYMPGLPVLESDAFETMLGAFMNARKKQLTDFSLMWVITKASAETVAPMIQRHLRASDYMGMTKQNRLMILLSNTDYTNAIGVQKRLSDAGIRTQIIEAVQE